VGAVRGLTSSGGIVQKDAGRGSLLLRLLLLLQKEGGLR